ncbi:MAG: protein kinase, partial [Deltaproteobacteria bacterium]|nr:protein kinase [Deltaproteobacteria bacterium]
MKSSLLKKSFSNHYEIISSVFSDDSYEGFQAKRFEKLQLLKLIHKKTKALEDLQNDSLLSFQFSLLKGLDHPHLVKLYDFGLDDETGKLYYTQEWIEGFSLLESISSLTTQNLLSLFKQCLDALAYLHSQKIIHGHIKPENILIQKDNSNNLKVKLTDYGILGRSLEKCKISPFYHSPEEVLGEALLPQSDLFSLASVFYMALQKKAPFLEERAQLKQALEPIHLKNPEVDLYYSLLLSKMLEINPQYRISSAEACLDYIKSQGDEASISPWPINFKKEWVGRDEIGKSCVQFLKRVTEDPKRYQCLLIVGEKELSSSALLSEMKYVAEQMGVSVCLPGEKNSDQASVFFLDSTGENPQSSLEFNSSSIIWSMPPDQSERIIQELAAFKPETIRLRSLNRVEINQYLQKILQTSKVPPPLLEALYQLSAGIPSYLFEALEAFYGHYSNKFKNKIWDLSFFETNPPDPISLCFNPESIDRLLRTGCIKSDEDRWELELFQV